MEKRKKRDSRNNGKNLSRVEIYRIWDNVSIREQQLEAQLFKYSAQRMAEFPLSPRRCISHSVDIIYRTAIPTGAQWTWSSYYHLSDTAGNHKQDLLLSRDIKNTNKWPKSIKKRLKKGITHSSLSPGCSSVHPVDIFSGPSYMQRW